MLSHRHAVHRSTLQDTCPVCGKPANKMAVWGIAYQAKSQNQKSDIRKVLNNRDFLHQ